MQPVVPKIRVGDVLLGTKNLRNWLQTKSLLAYTQKLQAGVRVDNVALYIPHKKDRFVVATNAWNTFAACDFESRTVLLFCNPTHPDTCKKLEPRMTPGQFATWFIHTRERRPNLRIWPDWAYHLWASYQMNLTSSKNYHLGFFIPPGHDATFRMAGHNGQPRETILDYLHRAVGSGITRGNSRRRNGVHEERGYGPRLEDIHRDQRILRRVAKNPRIAKQVKSLPAFGNFWNQIQFKVND